MDVTCDPLPRRVRPGFATAIDIHVRAGAGEEADGLLCTATLRWPGGAHRWRFRGDVPAGGHVRIGTVQFEVPPDASAGEVVLEVALATGASHRSVATLVTA